ncbi:MAG: GNAT family N-acetyltransferase [Lachnospiraceae bacterium]|nr:GNAT family N-acetyltransferase [Lachnospiraceae bacterium]
MIRRANVGDIEGLNRLLKQVLNVHHAGRPDIFKGDAVKYRNDELVEIINDDKRPIFVSVDENNYVEGYAFCVVQQHIGDNILTDIKTLYIDDLCVDENIRGKHIGSKLFNYVKEYAKNEGFYNLTLNVWALNENAQKFYESMGLVPQKIGMETIL